MSRLQTIENRLKEINGAVFQELCDSYLTLRDSNYLAVSRVGSQTGKQKTTKGTPDTFFLLPNGNFLYSEITTDISTKNKLAKDIEACFDTDKTKIPSEKIQEVILCFNWNIDQGKINELNELARRHNPNVVVRYVTLQELAMELNFHHRDLAHNYLGLPLDTGQIVSIDKFITEYEKASRGIATPLNNPFLHREEELNQLKVSIDNYDFLILTGAPGVGKTKLAIETIKDYLLNNPTYQTYGVSYKNHTLLDDLFQYFDPKKDYILFVDDANRIDAFEQILGFFKAIRSGNLKVVITVRDYALREIEWRCQEFLSQTINVLKFTDEQIIEIIKSNPFEILNSAYHDLIVRISEGNPRIAIMTALLAKKEQNIDALRNVSDLFEKYFSTFIKDDGEFDNKLNIACLGLISFFYTVPYKNQEVVGSILEKFDITYEDFIDAIDRLDKLELVEIQFEHVKVPEQNLSTFFFYKTFVKDNLLSFDVLLNYYFDSHKSRLKDCVIPANNTFGSQNVMDKLQPFLHDYWIHIKSNNDKAFNFLQTFWFYLQDQVLEFAYQYIEQFPKANDNHFSASYENNQFNTFKDNLIELLGNFLILNSRVLQDSIELLFEYVSRLPNKLPELIHKVREMMLFDWEDERRNFYRQKILFRVLVNGVNYNSNHVSTAFYELSKTFLSHTFRQIKGGRKNSIVHYQFPIQNTKSIQEFRKKIWDTLNNSFTLNPDLAFDALKYSSHVNPDVNREIMEFDIPYVLSIIDNQLTSDSFEHCKYVQDQIRWFKRHDFDLREFIDITERFVNETYKMFLKIDWNRLRDKEMFEFDDFREYEQLKEAEIRNSFLLNDIDEINSFYDSFFFIKNLKENDWDYNKTLDFIIDENCSTNFNIGLSLINEIVERLNEIKYIPYVVFMNHLKTENEKNQIWQLIQSKNFELKEHWEMTFYQYIHDSFINEDLASSLIKSITGMEKPYTILFDGLERFLKIDSKLFQKILRLVTEKNENEKTSLRVWMNFFSNHFDKLGDDYSLIKKAYTQQYLMQNYFDYEGKGLLEILKKDKDFLIDFIDSLYASKDRHSLSGDNKEMSYVWEIEGIEETMTLVFDLVITREVYFGILEHFCNAFFRNIQGDEKKLKADKFIRQYVLENNKDHNKMEIIVDIIRYTRKELFEEILLLYISLNHERNSFEKLLWTGTGGTYSGDVIIGDIRASEWRNILEIVKRSDIGVKLIPIKTFISERIEVNLKSAEEQRKRKFLIKDY